MMHGKIRAIVTDLDGTLLTDNKQVGQLDRFALEKLGELGIVRVAATGRNLRISQEVLEPDFPFDYLVFSTGSGIYDWKKKKIVQQSELNRSTVDKIVDRFMAERFDFTIHHPIPENYTSYYHRHHSDNHHFNHFVNFYRDYGEPFNPALFELENACQILTIMETNVEKYEQLIADFDNVKLVRTTSPFDNKAMWIEVFPEHISKLAAIQFLKKQHSISPEEILGIGNDYNDIDFLQAVGHPRVVANAHPDLLDIYPKVGSNQHCGVYEAIVELIPEIKQ
jgi:Cof subfamily protein (haloacid dehalogenase superfamily)